MNNIRVNNDNNDNNENLTKEQLCACLIELRDVLGIQPRWSWLNFFGAGYTLLGYNKEFKEAKFHFEKVNSVLKKYIELYPEKKTAAMQSVLDGELFLDYRYNKINKVGKSIKKLLSELS